MLSEEEARFSDIYRRYDKHIRAYCTRRKDISDVADAVAETFLVVWRKIERIPEGDAILPWLYGVAYRVFPTNGGTRREVVGSSRSFKDWQQSKH